jgi:hypothetical protein
MDSSSHLRAQPVSPALFDIHFSRGFLTDTHSMAFNCCQLAQRYSQEGERKFNNNIKIGRERERERKCLPSENVLALKVFPFHNSTRTQHKPTRGIRAIVHTCV